MLLLSSIASAFLQKAADNVSITREDINGFMNALCTTPDFLDR